MPHIQSVPANPSTFPHNLAYPRPLPRRLTDKEVETIGLLAQGHTYQTAAHELCLSVDGIKNRVRSVRSKVRARHLGHAIAIAKDLGVI